MRRAKSAPANLCSMCHRRRRPATELLLTTPLVEAIEAPTGAQIRRTGEADAMSEVVTRVSTELDITDSTEQLMLFILARIVVTMDEVKWRGVFVEVGKRLLVSFVTHHFMDWMLQTAASHPPAVVLELSSCPFVH